MLLDCQSPVACSCSGSARANCLSAGDGPPSRLHRPSRPAAPHHHSAPSTLAKVLGAPKRSLAPLAMRLLLRQACRICMHYTNCIRMYRTYCIRIYCTCHVIITLPQVARAPRELKQSPASGCKTPTQASICLYVSLRHTAKLI